MLTLTSQRFLYATVAVAMSVPSAAFADEIFWHDLFEHRCDCVQLVLTAEWISATRTSDLISAINGPDSQRVAIDGEQFNPTSGIRIGLGFQTPEYRVELVHSNYGEWISSRNGTLRAGLAFDEGLGTSWAAGANSINAGTYFSTLARAATAPGGETDEHDGLGSNIAFGDANPTFRSYYQSVLTDFQLNILNNDPCGEIRVGIGYRNMSLDEQSGMTISGRYRATDVAGANGGLSHAALLGAGLSFLGGTANGFQDESVLGNNGVADVLTLDFDSLTSNQLNGFQVIVDTCIYDDGMFDLTAFVKAGAYHNQATGRFVERYTGTAAGTSIYGQTKTDSKDSVAFVGGVALQGGYQISKHIQFVLGYEGTFVSGVALSPEQAAGISNGAYNVQTDGTMLVHGGNAGVEITY